MILPLVSLVFLVVGLNVARSLKRAAELNVVLFQHSSNDIVHLAARLLVVGLHVEGPLELLQSGIDLAARPLAQRNVAQAR